MLPKTRKGRPLFPDEKGGYMDAGRFERLWLRWQKSTGLLLTAHQLRHGYATIINEGGLDMKECQTVLGHAQISTTMDIYTDIREARMQSANQKITAALDAL